MIKPSPIVLPPGPQDTSVLGATLTNSGCRFGLWAPRASRVELALVNADRSQTNHDMTLSDGVWTVEVPGVAAGQRYGYRVHGEWNPNKGMRFNPAKLLLDPYARAITAGVDYAGPISDHTAESNYQPDTRDSAMSVPLSVVVANTPPPRPIARRRPLSESVIYETHLKGITQTHPQVPEHLRGTYAGMAYPAVIDHLLDIGINTVEFLPLHHFVSEPFVVGRGLVNYWGYNTLGFFAPHAAYSSSGSLGGQVGEFKEMVSALHDAGIEVILDVVYNHTGEGGHEGPTLSFRGIDHGLYYRLTQDLHNDYNVTGTGNSLDTSHEGVLDMVLDSMRYWVTEMGVDGFRFDLATTLVRDGEHHVDQNHPFKRAIADDPVLADIKMIAEPWDIGPYGYQVGAWGPGWSEWNDKFRDFARDYWRGATHGVQVLATRLAGSPDLFDQHGRDATASVNFITAHDGFTMRDLVTYDMKHNQANGEHNRDGHDHNRSWNHGWEGETDDEEIVELRHRQVKNMMATQLLASGVPMITAGDEMGRTQRGNNNAYCQDSPLSWVHWETIEEWGDVADLTRQVLALRAEHPVLRRAEFGRHAVVLDEAGEPTGRFDLAWLDGDTGEMGDEDWTDQSRTVLGMYLSDQDEAFVVWFHNGPDDRVITLPPEPWGVGYRVLVSTVAEQPEQQLLPGDRYTLTSRSLVVMGVDLVADDQPLQFSASDDARLDDAEMD
ncbi:glycogen debranching protein GlgX [Aestuariimicrobium ganziense]|uniref:glycogen debranching protein GlgX n=1 Tax=Aestuariimicrobium ganziense TaxID=2773677 RepID=UPI001942CA2E|nr:glycogen debranching protein GlgX [Aestuariimicrobium ganziense]